MKKMRFFLAISSMLLLTACFDVNEDIEIKTDGKGVYALHTDMSQLLQAMQNYLGEDSLYKQMQKKSIDTTVKMRDLMDTARNIPAETKTLTKDGTVHMLFNMDKKQFQSDMVIPFASLNNLQSLYNSMNNHSLGYTQLFKNLAGKSDTTSTAGDVPDMNQFNAIYDFESHDGLISRKLNADRWKKLQAMPEFSQMKEASKMGIAVNYTLTIKIPRPFKKVDNTLAKFFPDRKTIIMQYNLIEVFDHPEKFEYTIAY